MRGGTAKLRGRGRDDDKSCFCIAMSAKRLQVGSPTREDWRRAPVARKTGGVPQLRVRLAACPSGRLSNSCGTVRAVMRALQVGSPTRESQACRLSTTREETSTRPTAPRNGRKERKRRRKEHGSKERKNGWNKNVRKVPRNTSTTAWAFPTRFTGGTTIGWSEMRH